MRFWQVAVASGLLFIARPVAASDFGIGFLAAMLGGFAIAIWPLVLPLFYLRGSSNKIKLYFVLALTAFGLLILLSAPYQLLILIKMPSIINNAANIGTVPGAGFLYLAHLLALGASLWALPKVRRHLAGKTAAP